MKRKKRSRWGPQDDQPQVPPVGVAIPPGVGANGKLKCCSQKHCFLGDGGGG